MDNKLDYPKNLVQDLSDGDFDILDLPMDYDICLEYELRNLAQKYERSIQMLRMYYQEKMTLSAIAKEYGLTLERVRQIIGKMLLCLRHPSRLNYIRYGIAHTVERLCEEQYKKGFWDGLNAGENPFDVTVKRNDISLEDMELSVRAYHVLSRAGMKTAEDVSKLTFGKLMRMRNLGRKTLDEIISKMKSLGYDTSAMEPREG